MLDIVSVGDATLDTFVKLKDASVMCSLEKDNCMLCLSYADKIPVVRLDQKVAGNALNNAVGSARLGMRTGFYGIVGDDDTAKKIKERMIHEGIDRKYLVVQKGSNSNYSVVLTYGGERTILVYHHPRKYKLPDLDGVKWVYYTSLYAKGANKLSLDLAKFVKKNKVFLAYNPGTYQIREGLRKLRRMFDVTNVLFVNKEEAQAITGDHLKIPQLLKKMKSYVPGRVVITDGGNGSYTYDGEKAYFLPVFPVKPIEKTGAGDAFATGFVAALFHKQPAREAMRWGSANSSSVILKIGPQDGLLHLDEMKKMLTKYKSIQPQLLFTNKTDLAKMNWKG